VVLYAFNIILMFVLASNNVIEHCEPCLLLGFWSSGVLDEPTY
jgi:hypothetical protein